jgi:hypothetical protein
MTEERPVNEEVVEAEIVQPEIIDGPPTGMQKMYLSGPMTGIENYNHEFFNRVAAEFRMAGFEVCSPSEFFDGDRTRERKEYMREAVKYLLEADTVILLPGWDKSQGARLEAAIAQELDLIIVEYVERDDVDLETLQPLSLQEEVENKKHTLTGTNVRDYPAGLTPVEEPKPDGNYGSFSPITKSE